MTRILPYRVVPDSDVLVNPWMIDGEEQVPLGDHLPDWDYNTDLRLTRKVQVRPSAIASACGLPQDTQMAWSVVWRATDTKLTSTSPNVPIRDGATSLSATIEGHQLGTAIELSTRIVLAVGQTPAPTLASAAGSILWRQDVKVNLIGDAARFPIAVIDFEAAFLDPDASLALEVDDDLDTPLLGGLQLLINSIDTELVAAIQKPAGGSQVRAQLLASVDEFVVTQLLDFARRRSEELETFKGDDDSIGAVCLGLTNQTISLRTLCDEHQWHHARYQTSLVGAGRRRGMGRQIR